LTHQFPHT